MKWSAAQWIAAGCIVFAIVAVGFSLEVDRLARYLWLRLIRPMLRFDAARRREHDAWRAKLGEFVDKHRTAEYPAVDADDAECVS
jgi:ATP phosphoribosyltransferase regulatory subunit HisZ